jgi:uncharacterized membrane protein
MNKHQFMNQLRQALSPLDGPAVAEILADFEEHFASGCSRGKSEETIAAELGDPLEIGRQYAEAAAAVRRCRPRFRCRPCRTPSPRVREGALLGVIALNLFIGIPLWLTLFATLAGFWAGAGSIGAAAVVLFVLAVFQAGVISLILVLFAIALTALTILAVILMVFLTKWLFKGSPPGSAGTAAWFTEVLQHEKNRPHYPDRHLPGHLLFLSDRRRAADAANRRLAGLARPDPAAGTRRDTLLERAGPWGGFPLTITRREIDETRPLDWDLDQVRLIQITAVSDQVIVSPVDQAGSAR